MIYLRVKSRVLAPVDQPLTLGDAADLLADASLQLDQLPLSLPTDSGIWRIDALELAREIQIHYPQETVSVLGDGVGWLHRESPAAHARRRHRTAGYFLRCAAACIILFCGSALAMAWFHADVNMQDAQLALYTGIAGSPPSSMLMIALPYALGILLGTGLYFALFSSKKISPLLVKLRQYREDMEKNAEQHS